MFAWVRKRLGYHVCERWTPWESMEASCSRNPSTNLEWLNMPRDESKIWYTCRWQERKCVECGWTEQRDLDY